MNKEKLLFSSAVNTDKDIVLFNNSVFNGLNLNHFNSFLVTSTDEINNPNYYKIFEKNGNIYVHFDSFYSYLEGQTFFAYFLHNIDYDSLFDTSQSISAINEQLLKIHQNLKTLRGW